MKAARGRIFKERVIYFHFFSPNYLEWFWARMWYSKDVLLIPEEMIITVTAEQISILNETKINFFFDTYKQPLKSCPKLF